MLESGRCSGRRNLPYYFFWRSYRFAVLKRGGTVDIFVIGNCLMVKFILLHKFIAIYKIIIY